MVPDIEVLLSPTADDPPCGPDLSYHIGRLEIERAFDKPFSIDPTEAAGQADAGADWNSVIDQILNQLNATKDIWLAVYLCRAAAYAGRFDLLEGGAQLLAELLSRYWDRVHPLLEDGDPAMRKAACDSLGVPSSFLSAVRRMPLLLHGRLGQYNLDDFERLARGGASEPDHSTFQAFLASIEVGALKDNFARAKSVEDFLRRAEAIFVEKCGEEASPQFAGAYEVLERIRKALGRLIREPSIETADQLSVQDGLAESTGAPRPDGVFPGLRTRDDVLRTLEHVCQYYRVNEPSSPIPLLLERAKMWVSGSFLEILSDIAPQSLPEAQRVLTRQDKP